MNPKLEIRGACKTFSRVQANDNISLSIGRGEVRALLGENGAGKSTLMNCLYGLIPMDRGEIFIDGRKADIKNCNVNIAIGLQKELMLMQRQLHVGNALVTPLMANYWNYENNLLY